MSNRLSLLCVHGVGHAEIDADFRKSWSEAIIRAIQSVDQNLTPDIDFLSYDDLFDKDPPNVITYGIAFAKLLASATVHGIGDLFASTRSLEEVPTLIRWTAGMIAQWSVDEKLQTALRSTVLDKLKSGNYDVVLAHSLGSLICYDTLVRNPDAIKEKTFVTFGSQIGNPAVRDIFAGRIQDIPCRKWYHLFNREDRVLTYPLEIAANNFRQVLTPFDVPNDVLNHNATWYLSRPETVATVWHDVVPVEASRSIVGAAREIARIDTRPTRRALLIGINDYPRPEDRLEGCVNDVFLMSSVLQESGFKPDEIRVVLNERATAQGIMDRLHWLLDGVRNKDERVLFYSGHGAQIPRYNPSGKPDSVDECLVPYDFDWTPQRAILDRQFCQLYSQLPYDCYFVAMLDCCHSGGMTRDGGPRIRGLTPPDDIRHRALQWNASEGMWVPREFDPLNKSLKKSKDGADYLGSNGATRRLGRSMALRTQPDREYNKKRDELGHHGPYLPILLEACQEQQLSYEYRDGATSYGAYTFCMAKVLREQRARGTNPSFKELSRLVTAKLRRLEYNQTPNLVGFGKRIAAKIPWDVGAADAGRAEQPVSKKRAAKTRRKQAPPAKKTAAKKKR